MPRFFAQTSSKASDLIAKRVDMHFRRVKECLFKQQAQSVGRNQLHDDRHGL